MLYARVMTITKLLLMELLINPSAVRLGQVKKTLGKSLVMFALEKRLAIRLDAQATLAKFTCKGGTPWL